MTMQQVNPFAAMASGEGLFSLEDFFKNEPAGQFFSFQDQFGKAPRQRRFFQNQFQQIQNEFLGRLGQQVRQGQMPTQTFTGFLEDMPFTQRFASMTPFERGSYNAPFAPRTRWLPF